MASRSLGSLTIDMILRLGGFSAGMDKAARDSEKSMKRIQSSAKSLQTSLKGIFAGIGIAAGIQAVVRNTTESEDALRQLEARIKSTGNVAGVSVPDLEDYAAQLQGITTFSDDAIIQMQSLLLTFTNIRGPTVKDATRAILDVSTALGQDLNSSATLVGKALQDPVKGLAALGRVGVQFSKDQKEVIKNLVETGRAADAQNLILKELETRFGGAAEAAAGTFGGAIKQVQNAFGDLFEAKGPGLDDATKSLKEFADLLKDPETIRAAQALTSAIISLFKGATSAITETVNVTRFIGESLAAQFNGPAGDDIVRLQDEIADLEKILNGNALTDSQFLRRLRFFGEGGFVEWYSDEDLRKRIGQLRQQLDSAYKQFPSPIIPPAAAAAGTGGGPTAAPAPSEEFLKLEAQLREQIVLFGNSSEAAKLSYQIQAGAIDDITKAEGRRLIGLGAQLDALKANAEESKAQAKEWQQLTKDIESAAQQAVQDIELPAIEGLTQDAEDFFSVLDEGAAITEALRTPQEQYNAELANLDKLLAAGAIGAEIYARGLKKAQDDLKGANDQWTVFKDQLARNSQDIIADTLVDGFDKGVNGILKSFGEMIKQLIAQAVAADLTRRLFGGPNDGLSGGLLGGLFGFLGGARAMGGPVAAGVPYVVGERGPEVIVPRSAGSVIPNSRIRSSLQVTQTFVLPPGGYSRQTQQQIAADAARGIASASRRNN